MRRLALIASACLLALCVNACGTRPYNEPHIVAPGFKGAGVAYPNTKPGVPYTVGDLIICLDRPGKVTIEDIEMIKPEGGLQLDDFSVIPNAMESGAGGFEDSNVPISRLTPSPAKPVVMTHACPADWNAPPVPNPQSVALLLQYSKSSDRAATSAGITVLYSSSGHKDKLTLRWTVGLCPDETAASTGCLSGS